MKVFTSIRKVKLDRLGMDYRINIAWPIVLESQSFIKYFNKKPTEVKKCQVSWKGN